MNTLLVLDSVSRLVWDRADLPNIHSLLPYSFSRAYATATWTLPSSASMVSGVYPPQHGLCSTKDRWTYSGQTIFPEREKGQICSDVPYLKALAPIAKYKLVGHFSFANPLKACAHVKCQEVDTLYFHSASTHFPYCLARNSAFVQSSTVSWQVRMSEKAYPERLSDEFKAKYDDVAEKLQEAQIKVLEKIDHAFEVKEGQRIVLTSDHGENWDYHYAHGHGRSFNLNRDTLHVPLLTNIEPRGDTGLITSNKNSYNILMDKDLEQGSARAYHYKGGAGGNEAAKAFTQDDNQVRIDAMG